MYYIICGSEIDPFFFSINSGRMIKLNKISNENIYSEDNYHKSLTKSDHSTYLSVRQDKIKLRNNMSAFALPFSIQNGTHRKYWLLINLCIFIRKTQQIRILMLETYFAL
jgi:hypothetical protein